MEPPGIQRRLGAILASDMVGYSRLIEADEERTLARQKEHRKEPIDPTIAAYYRGRIVKSTGDGLLVEFPSVVDAFRCAVSIQLAMPEREAQISEAQRITYRVGINLGDIVIDDDDIYGDGVNIAARLEALAEPGGICVSRTVFDQVKGKVNSQLEDLGAQRVKNIAEPIQVYGVKMQPEAAATGYAGPARKQNSWRWAAMAAALAVIIAVAGIVYWNSQAPEPKQASVENMSDSLPAKPSIAVLPFANMSDEPEQEYFSDGVTEDIITNLSRLSELLVISRTSTLGYKGQAVDVKQVGNQLGVRYVLEGSVRKSGDQLRITAQLIDATSGYHVWAERYDRELKDIFTLQDEVTQKIVVALSVKLTEKEQRLLAHRYTNNTEAHEHYLRGRLLFGRITKQENEAARKMYQKAIDHDPTFARAYAGLALTYVDDFRRRWGSRQEESVERALELAHKAVAMDDTLPQGHWALGYIYLYGKAQHDLAMKSTERAIALDPNYADAYALLGSIYFFTGRVNETIRFDSKAMRLNPSSNSYIYWVHLGRSYYMQGRLDEAVAALQTAVNRNFEYFGGHVYLAAAYARLGQQDEAEWEVDQILTLDPDFTVEKWREIRFFESPDYLNRLIGDLRKAGLR